MKKISLLFLPLIIFSCKKEKCVSCIEQDASGTVTNHRVACDKSSSYIDGFEEGFKQKAKDNGNTAICAEDE